MLVDDILKGESEVLEFKRQPSEDSEKWLKTVVAFANGKGGRILFGVGNDQTVVGLEGNLFALRDSIADAVCDACEPSIPMSIGISTVQGKPILVLEISQGRQCPYYVKSLGESEGVFVRYDATTRKADYATLQELRLMGSRRSYDALECRGWSVSDEAVEKLCHSMYERAVRNIHSPAQRSQVPLVTRAQLRKWGILIEQDSHDLPTNAFALLTGEGPLTTVTKCAVFKGLTRKEFIDKKTFMGPLQAQLDAAYQYILEKINVGVSFNGLERVEKYEIPLDAVREIVVNAFAHRSYVNCETSPVSISVYDDRIEVLSPGALPRGVTVDKALEGYSECRNEALVHALAYMGLMEDWGTGLPRVVGELEGAGLPKLKMNEWPNAVQTIIYRQLQPKSGGENGGDGINEGINIPSEAVNEVVNTPSEAVNTPSEGREVVNEVVNSGIVGAVLKEIAAHSRIRKPALMAALKVSRATIERAVARLQREGKVEFRGAPKTGGYYLTEGENKTAAGGGKRSV